MNKLLLAALYRLKRDKVFWLCFLAMFAYAVLAMLGSCYQALQDTTSFQYTLDMFYFFYAFPIGLLIAVAVSLFLGTEYSDGTIRNKLIVGHTRRDIYLANLITNFVCGFFLLLAGLLGGLCGIPFLGVWKMGKMVWLFLLVSILCTAAYAAIFTLIGMLCSNKAVSAVLSILLFLGLLVLAFKLYFSLAEPEVVNGLIITKEGMQMGEPEPNPRYLTGLKREVYQFAMDFFPTGQCIQMEEQTVVHPIRMMLSSLCITFMTTLGGIAVFKKKDLK